MSLQIIAADACRPARWKNGGGWTRELLAWPGPQDWALRISVADIESDGPFSDFADTDRYFAVLDGPGVRLGIGGAAIGLDAQSPLYAFDGGLGCDCRLQGGATRDFNLMVRRARAELQWHPVGEAAPLMAGAQWRGLFSVGGGSVREPQGSWLNLPPLSLVWSTSAAAWQTRLAGLAPRGWWMQLRMKEAMP